MSDSETRRQHDTIFGTSRILASQWTVRDLVRLHFHIYNRVSLHLLSLNLMFGQLPWHNSFEEPFLTFLMYGTHKLELVGPWIFCYVIFLCSSYPCPFVFALVLPCALTSLLLSLPFRPTWSAAIVYVRRL